MIVLPGTRSRLALALDALTATAEAEGPDACVEWPGARNANGYGRIGRKGKVWLAHRLVWTVTFGPIPDGENICHACDNPPCVRPSHLFLGSQRVNVRDMMDKGRWGRWGDDRRIDLDRARGLLAAGGTLRGTARELGCSFTGLRHALDRIAA